MKKNVSYYSSGIMFVPHGRDRYASDPSAIGIRRGVEPIEKGVVELNFYAPQASLVEVRVNPEDSKEMFVREENGWWKKRLEGLRPGYQPLQFFVDSVECINPYAPIGFGANRAGNFAEIPGEEDALDLVKDVPHGSVRSEIYYSPYTKSYRNCMVYTPPGYDNTQESYPVLFLQHGGGENENCWIWQGKINNIMDNLIAQKDAVPCIIVMNSGYAYREDPKEDLFDQGNIGKLLVEDCLPFIESKFRIRTGRENRAIAGLSMGSFQTNATVHDYPQAFGWAGIFSGNLFVQPELPTHDGKPRFKPSGIVDTTIFHDKELVRSMKLIFIGVGEQEDNYERNREDVKLLQEDGAENLIFFSTPGYHEWRVWRKCAIAFLQKIFQ